MTETQTAPAAPVGSGVKFGLVDCADPKAALQQLLTLDSDQDGVPNYKDKAPFDPKVSHASRAPGDHHVRREAGLSTVAGPGTPSYRPGKHEDEWSKNVMHAVTKDGGFTFHDVTGDGPTKGYMVSVAKQNEQKIPMRDLTPDHIADYMSIHQQELKDPRNFLGGWVHKGNVYLDVSRHSDDHAEAMQLARANKQLGIYDIGKGQTLMTEQEKQQAAHPSGTPRAASFAGLPVVGDERIPKGVIYVATKPTAAQIDDPAERLAFAGSFLTSLQKAAASRVDNE